MTTAREAAYLALMASIRNEDFITHRLDKWIREKKPEKRDAAFAYEIASGSARMALALDAIAIQLSTNRKLNLKMKERALLRTAVYQYCYMEKVPLYAIVNETIELAKKYCHKTFVPYLNALLRRLENPPSLPSGNNPEDLSIRYSYPLFFVRTLVSDYGTQVAQEVLRWGNIPPKTIARIRPGSNLNNDIFKNLTLLPESGLPIAVIDKTASISELAARPEIYIQNATPVALMTALAQQSKPPKRILDLCASPGGKLLAVHDFYPEAKLFANDVSEEKLSRVSENLNKYHIQAILSCGPGEAFASKETFDVIILDVPCSNSGVLNKRAEARWRLSVEALQGLKETQTALIRHALTLLSPSEGSIWYMTCSLLKEENEELIASIAKECNLNIEYSQTILPNDEGWDGGFCALLKKH